MNTPPLETTQKLQQELDAKETEAAKLIHWLKDHPNKSLTEKAEVRRRLNELLQAINDLVYKINPLNIYTVR